MTTRARIARFTQDSNLDTTDAVIGCVDRVEGDQFRASVCTPLKIRAKQSILFVAQTTGVHVRRCDEGQGELRLTRFTDGLGSGIFCIHQGFRLRSDLRLSGGLFQRLSLLIYWNKKLFRPDGRGQQTEQRDNT